MEENALIFDKNQKGYDTLIHNGYRYNKNKGCNKDGSTSWRCVNRKDFNASIKIDVSRTTILRKSQHTCQPNYEKNAILLKMNKLKKVVCENLAPIKPMFEKMFEETDESCQPGTSKQIKHIPNFHDKKDCLYQYRRKFLKSDKLVFHKLEDVVVPPALGEKFLVIEDGDMEKILVFSTTLSKKIMRKLKKGYYADGTFKSAPHPFYQLFTLHVDINSDKNATNIIPVLYALLPNKTQSTYTRLFTLIRDALHVNILEFKSDYEVAIMNAVKDVYPNAKISGCYFHYQKAIKKKAKEMKVTRTSEQRKLIRMTSILPLLPARYISDGWDIISNQIDVVNTMAGFKTYYQNQWYPRMSPGLLSCAGQRHRTTNSLEGWHHRINVLIPKRPSLYYFIHKIRKEAKHFDIKIKNSLFESQRKNRKNKYIQFDKKYSRLLKQLNRGEISVGQFLKKTIYLQLLL